MDQKKIKILVLDKDDNRLEGHAMSTFMSLPDCYDKRIVVQHTLYNDMSIALLNRKSIVARFFILIWRISLRLFYFVKYGIVKKDRRECQLRSFYGEEYSPFSAKWILSKNKNFTPDIITIHWTSRFLTSNIIKELHQKTNALIAFVGVDEAHLGAGCHYPTECDGYKKECTDCPAFVKGKRLPHDFLLKKIKNLKGIPFVVLGTPYFCRKALESSALKYAQASFSSVKIPKVKIYDKAAARKRFNIPQNSFVIMFSASRLDDVRKGLIYALDAIGEVSKEIPNLTVLMPGKMIKGAFPDNIKIITPGYLNKEELFMAFCASDCFLSTTIADTGPMMVNFSVVLDTPVVSFDVGVAQDLVIHKQNGYIAKFKDSDDVAKGIRYLYHLTDSEKELMKANNREIIDKWEKKENVYEQLAKYYIKEFSLL